MKKYEAFGLRIASELELTMLNETPWEGEPDVRIIFGDVRSQMPEDKVQFARNYFMKVEPQRTYMEYTDEVTTLIENGNLMVLDPVPGIPLELFGVYVMGGLMGSLLYQRKCCLLHGSCVCKGDQAVIVCGESGAGKSTMAAIFQQHAWQIMTDDVAMIVLKDRKPYVQSSYASQKLWQDAADRLGKTEDELLPLYQESRKSKYHVKVENNFYNGCKPVTALVALFRGEETHFEEVDGFDKVNLLMMNRYQIFRDVKENANHSFQTFVDMAQHIKVYQCIRGNEDNASVMLYQEIAKTLEKI